MHELHAWLLLGERLAAREGHCGERHGETDVISAARRVNGDVVVSESFGSSQYRLARRNLNGAQTTALTDGGRDEARPAVSAEGSVVAFMRKATQQSDYDITILWPETGEILSLPLPGDQWEPALSPDGSELVFRDGTSGDIFWVSLESGESRTLFDHDPFSGISPPQGPTWSRDGEWISFIYSPGRWHFKAQASGWPPVYGTQTAPCTSPQVVECFDERVPYLVHADGTGGHFAYSAPPTTDQASFEANRLRYFDPHLGSPNFSFDGTKLVVSSGQDGKARVLDLVAGTVTIRDDLPSGGAERYWTRDEQILSDGPQAWLPEPLPSLPLGQTFGDELASNPSDEAAVNSATGNYAYATTDVALPGFDLPLNIARTYNSLDPSTSAFGPGWHWSLGAKLDVQQTGDVVARASDGQEVSFIEQQDGSFRPYNGGTATLTTVGGGYDLETEARKTYVFDADGKLTAVRSLNGHEVTLEHTGGVLSGIRDAAGRELTVASDGAERITRIALADGRDVEYGYDGSGRLETVTDLAGKAWTYAYDGASSRLASIQDPNGHWVVRNTYASGRVTGQLDATGAETTWAWDAAAETATVTDPAGKVWKDVYHDNVLLRSLDPSGKATAFRYDREFRLLKATDVNGNTTTMTYDVEGRMIARRAPKPLDQVETWTHNALDLPLSHRDARGNTTGFEYDARGNKTKETKPGNNVTSWVVNQDGLVQSMTNARGKTTTYAYDAAGNRTSETSPEGSRTTWDYDGYGRVLATVKPRGNVAGADPELYEREFTYDAADRRLTETDELDRTTTYAYDDAGNLVSVTNALGKTWTYEYDAANRRTKEIAPGNRVTEVAYDARGNVSAELTPSGAKTTHGYDERNRRIWTVSARGNETGADPDEFKTRFEFDAVGNLTKKIDPLGNATETTYDSLNRKTRVVYEPKQPNAYTSAVFTDSPTSYWRLEQTAGTTLADSAGTNSGAVSASGVTLGQAGALTSQSSKALQLAPSGPGSALVKGGGAIAGGSAADFTVEAWVKTSDGGTTGSPRIIYGEGRTSSPWTNWFLALAEGKPYLYWNGQVTTGGASIADGAWHQVAVTKNASAVTLYVDGGAVQSGTASNLVAPDSGFQARIGHLPVIYGSSRAWNGFLDEVAVYPSALSAGRIDAHFEAAAGPVNPPARMLATYAYDANDNLTAVTDAAGKTASATYDELDRRTSVTDFRGKTVTYAYDEVGNLVREESHLGNATTYGYDGDDRRIWTVSPRGNEQGAFPDDFKTTHAYDADGNLTATADPLGNETEYGYDRAGRKLSETDANEHTTTWAYDELGRLTKVTDARGGETAYAYDDFGRLTSRTDANGHATSYAYDADGRLETLTKPGPTLGQTRVWSFQYDAEGHVTKKVDANGNATAGDPNDGTTTWAYDRLGRPTARAYSDSTPDVTFAYDAYGNRASMADGQAQPETYARDALGRPTGVSRGSDSFAYEYDENGNVTERTLPDGTLLEYSYDGDGRLETVAQSGSLIATYGYDADGHLTSTILPAANGYAETRSYDQAGRLNELVNAKGATVLSRFSYTRDGVGNPTQIAKLNGAVERYTYDELDRITEVCYQASACVAPTDPFIRWTYDSVGNRLTEQHPAGATAYTYDPADQLVAQVGLEGAITYAYDRNGNQTQKGSRTFTYDLADRLASTTASGQTTIYAYDGEGRRLEQAVAGGATTRYLWDENSELPQLALERDGAGSLLRRYQHGLDLVSMRTGGADYYFHYDGLGSVANITNASGGGQWSYEYEPYGNLRSETQHDPGAPTNVARFTGELFDPLTDLYHLRARQYDPNNGRFLTTDPVTSEIGDPYVSAYIYVSQQPTTLVDPSGMFGCESFGFAAGACQGVTGGAQWTWGHRHTLLAAASTIPIIGNIASGLDAVIYAAEGNRRAAAIAAAGIITGGLIAKGIKVALPALRAVRAHIAAARVTGKRAGSHSVGQALMRRATPLAGRESGVAPNLSPTLSQERGSVLSSLRVHFPREMSGVAARGGTNVVQGANFTISGTRKINQIKSRGWSERIIENTIEAPYTTRAATNRATGGSATVYYRQSGAHVIIDDATGEVVQLSNRFDPNDWIPDDSIVDPYIPGS